MRSMQEEAQTMTPRKPTAAIIPSRLVRGRSLLAAVVAVCAVAPYLGSMPATPAHAADDEVRALRRQIQDLKETIDRLDSRLELLEESPSPPPTPRPSEAIALTPTVVATTGSTPSETPTLPARWDDLEHGMDRPQVEALLGQPERSFEVDGKAVWYYSYPEVGAGSVVFGPDGGVTAWRKPPFAGWWHW